MTTGYWVRGTTTDRTKVHLVCGGKAICGSVSDVRKTYQICGNGAHLNIVECTKCLALAKPWGLLR